MKTAWSLERLGEDALLLRLGERIDIDLNTQVHRFAAGLVRRRPPWLLDIVPAYASLALCIDTSAFADALDPQAEAETWLLAQEFDLDHAVVAAADRLHTIRVHYGADDGPDLEAVARYVGLTPAEVIARHTAVEYRVAMLGFAAGFPYLIGMDPILAIPRHDTPRTRVAAGSVGIGGAQTGIYPKAGPGGWQIIGRTTVALFDAVRDPPALLSPGDRVRFIATNIVSL